MEREANYAAVGAFVLLVVLMAGLFVYWYSDAHERRDYTRYEIYFEGSVSGLTIGAPVRFLGVDVGRVVDMRVDPRDSGRVQVIADIDSSAPVSERTVAELSLQGVTGLLYIDLIEITGVRRLSAKVEGIEYPVIRSARSNFDVFLSSLPDLVALVSDVAERAAEVLSDENLAAVSSTLANVDAASRRLPGTVQEIRDLAADLRTTSAEIRAAVADVRSVTTDAGPEMTAAVRRVREVADNLAEASAQLEQLVADNRQDLRSFTRNGLAEFEQLVREGRLAARQISELSRSLQDDPSRLLYQPAQSGVEIPE